MSVASDLLLAARMRADLTQVQLGRRAGVAQTVVSAYERGRREPSVAALRRLLRAAGFELELTLHPVGQVRAPFTGPVGRLVQRRRDEARALLTDRGHREPAVFGSVARGTDRPDSDVDLLVDLPDGAGLVQLNRAAIDLEDLLGARVDLVPRGALRPRVAADAAADLVAL